MNIERTCGEEGRRAVVSVCMQGRARASMNFEPMAEEPIRHNHESDDPGHQAQSMNFEPKAEDSIRHNLMSRAIRHNQSGIMTVIIYTQRPL